MKKSNLFLVIMTALIVMSCSKDETTMSIPQESNAIEFGTYVGRDAQTRATSMNLGELQKSANGFGVFAYYTVGSTWIAANPAEGPATSTPNFMYNQEVKWNSGNSIWKYDPVKYWPNNVDDKVSFFAYGPYSGGSTNNISAFAPDNANAGDPKLTFTVNGTVKDQTDLVWGVKTDDGLPFLDQTKQTIGGDIKFQFKHALARIGFNVQAMVNEVTDGTVTSEDIALGTQIVVTQVELIGKFYASGALNLNNTEANVPLWEGVAAEPAERIFELSSTANNFVNEAAYGEDSHQTTGQLVSIEKAQLNADDSYLMVIPQAFTTDPANALKIRVTYDVITKDIKLETGQSKVTNVITSTPFAFDFVGGNAYTFNLHLGMTSVKFSAEVAEWVTKDGENDLETVVNVPINTN